MPVKINGSTSGSVTLAAPATGTDVTLTLPNVTAQVAITANQTFTGNIALPTTTSIGPSGTTLGAYTSYTPTLTATTTNPTLGTGSSIGGSYIRIGNLVIGSGFALFGSSGTNAGAGSYILTLPVARNVNSEVQIGSARYVDASAGYQMFAGVCFGSTSGATAIHLAFSAGMLTATYPVVPAANDQIWFQFMYEAA